MASSDEATNDGPRQRIARVIVHVNQHVIRRNLREDTPEPPITVRRGRTIVRCNEAIIFGQDGQPAARIVYSANKPLACGARVWLETTNRVEIVSDP